MKPNVPDFPLSKARHVNGSRHLAREKALQILCACENSGIRWQDVFQHIIFREFEFGDDAPDENRLLTPDEIAEMEADTTIRWDMEDVEFIRELIEATNQHAGFSEGLIERFSQNWDSERITLLDSILLRMTIAELISFPEIPPKVSINVALDLAKRFSTDNSPAFINGMLDGIYTELQEQNLIQKTGRGLVDK